MTGRSFGAVALGGLALLPVMIWWRGARIGGAGLLAAQAAMAAPLRRGLAEMADHLEDRFAAARAEVLAAADAAVPDPGPEIVSGRIDAAAPAMRIAPAAGPRLRLVPAGPRDAGTLDTLAATLDRFPGMRRVSLRPASASIGLEAAMPAAELAERLERAGLIRILGPAPRPVAAHGAAAALGWIDALIRLRSRGQADLDSVLAMLAVALGVLGRDPALAGIPPGELAARIAARRRVGGR